MKDALDRILDKLEQSDARLNSIDVTLGKQHVSLEEHIRRTALLETEIKGIKHHVSMVQGVSKFIGILGTAVALAAAVKALWG